MRGRKPRPTHLKLITGNPGHRPINEDEPKPRLRMPLPPVELNEDGLIEWRRVSRELYELGLLTSLDRAALAAYCQAYGRWIRAERAFAEVSRDDTATGGLLARGPHDTVIVHPLINIANKAMDDMRRLAVEFGMTPSARSRIKAEGPISKDDPAAKYLTR